MNIVHVHDKQVRGAGASRVELEETGSSSGIAVYLARVVNAQGERGDRVRTLRCTPDVDIPRTDEHHAVFPSRATRRDDALTSDLLDWLERAEPDVVHLHSVYYALHPSVIDGILARWPTVGTIHDVTPVCFRRDRLFRGQAPCHRPIGAGCVTSGCFLPGGVVAPAEWLKRLLHHRATLPTHRRLPVVVSPSRALAHTLATCGFPQANLHVVPLFTRFERDAFAEYAPPDRTPAHIVCLGRIADEKGQHTLLDALQRLAGTLGWTATIAGEGPALPALRARLAGTELATRVTLPGRLGPDSAAQLYASADIVAVPSLIPESFGLVGVEAMSFARPVAAFPSGGVAEWLVDGETGLLAAHADADDLAAKLAQLIADPVARTRLGAAGQARVRERFTLPAHLDALDAVYTESTACQPTARAS